MILNIILSKNHNDTGHTVSLWIIDFLSVLITFGTFTREGFGSDTLFHMYRPEDSIETWLRSGRIAAWAMSELLYRLGFSATNYYYICYFLFIILWTFVLLYMEQIFFSLFTEIICNYNERDCFAAEKVFITAAVILITFTAFLNVFGTEYFMFTECFLVFPFAYFFVCYGALLITRRHFLAGSLLFVIGCLYYQVAGLTGMILLGTYYAAKDQYRFSWRLFTKEILISLATMLSVTIGTACTWLLIKAGVIDSTNKFLVTYSPLNLLDTLYHQWWSLLRDNFELYPIKWIPALLWIAPLLLSIVLICLKQAYSSIVTILLLQVMYTVGTSLFAVAGDYWSARVIFPFYTCVAMAELTGVLHLYWDAATSSSLKRRIARLSERLAVLVMALFCCSEIVLCNLIGADHRASNALDLANANAVLDRIEEYERENSTHITEIMTCYDSNVMQYYPEVRFTRYQVNERTMAVVPYSLIHLAAAERGREFINGGAVPSEEYDRYFAGKDWNSLDCDEQLVFSGHTAYWCIF